jgi:hypothetical protein
VGNLKRSDDFDRYAWAIGYGRNGFWSFHVHDGDIAEIQIVDLGIDLLVFI